MVVTVCYRTFRVTCGKYDGNKDAKCVQFVFLANVNPPFGNIVRLAPSLSTMSRHMSFLVEGLGGTKSRSFLCVLMRDGQLCYEET